MILLIRLIDLYILLVFLAALGTWFDPRGKYPIVALLYRITEPPLAPIRRFLRRHIPMAGIDISPFLLILLLLALKHIFILMM